MTSPNHRDVAQKLFTRVVADGQHTNTDCRNEEKPPHQKDSNCRVDATPGDTGEKHVDEVEDAKPAERRDNGHWCRPLAREQGDNQCSEAEERGCPGQIPAEQSPQALSPGSRG